MLQMLLDSGIFYSPSSLFVESCKEKTGYSVNAHSLIGTYWMHWQEERNRGRQCW